MALFMLFLVIPAGVAEWQTRRTQNPLPARACGFDSLPRHQLKYRCFPVIFVFIGFLQKTVFSSIESV
jgi:hypothetical protein